jgi:molybdenum-dependent DNA-binding transcriptional regulator ModE
LALSKYEQLEEERGKPLKEILIEAFARYGSTHAAARELGVSQSTFSLWMLRCGLAIRSELIEREPA